MEREIETDRETEKDRKREHHTSCQTKTTLSYDNGALREDVQFTVGDCHCARRWNGLATH